MTCLDLHPYFDDELDAAHAAQFEEHLLQCAACTAELERLRAVRSAVRLHAPYYRKPVRRARVAAWASLVAAACLAAVLVYRPSTNPAMENEVIAAHLRSLQANHLLDVPSTDRHTVKPWFTGKLDFAPEVSQPDGFELIGGRLDYLANRPVAALVYMRRRHTINVFTWPAPAADHAPSSTTREGFHVLHWTRQGMEWWAVSDAAEDDLRALSGSL